jgi:hypothetical protein
MLKQSSTVLEVNKVPDHACKRCGITIPASRGRPAALCWRCRALGGGSSYERPSAYERGYDSEHVRLRRQLAPQVALGQTECWRCGRVIAPGEPWDLGHDDRDRSLYRGPEHEWCNRRAGGLARHGKLPAATDRRSALNGSQGRAGTAHGIPAADTVRTGPDLPPIPSWATPGETTIRNPNPDGPAFLHLTTDGWWRGWSRCWLGEVDERDVDG